MKNKKVIIGIVSVLLIGFIISGIRENNKFDECLKTVDSLVATKKYDEAEKELDKARKIKNNDIVTEKQDLIDFNKNQLKVYSEGVALLEKGYYDDAMKKLTSVDGQAADIKQDAESKIVICKQKLIPLKIDEAEKSLNNKEFNKVYKIIDEIITLDNNNKDVVKLKENVDKSKTAYDEEQRNIALAKKEEENRKKEEEIARKETAAKEEETQPAFNSNDSSNTHVYWTPKGKSYHSSTGCPTLSRSKTIYEGTIEESGKYDPCDRCM